MSTTRLGNISSSEGKKNKPWHLGNVTIRSAYRLAAALRVLRGSEFEGNLADDSEQAAFLGSLVEHGVVARAEGDVEDLAWVGRKWRSALYQLGFITPELTRGLAGRARDARILETAAGIGEIGGAQYALTPNGKRLAEAETIAAQQDCFLRSLLAYRVPTQIEQRLHKNVLPFSPLRIVLRLLLDLGTAGLKGNISFEEMASLVQFCKNESEVPKLVTAIVAYREAREKTSLNKRVFDLNFRKEARKHNGEPVTLASLGDYADTNFRYLKATGLLAGQTGSIAIAHGKLELVERILSEPQNPYSAEAYLRELWTGASLPTDNEVEAVNTIKSLERELRSLGWTRALSPLVDMSPAGLDQIRLRLIEELRLIHENNFSATQREKVPEIIRLLEVMDNRKLCSEEYHSEAPAYLEWTFWRAFLAINTLVNAPWEVRRFGIGEDLRPIYHAPSRKPDMVCEFSEWVMVVEVTFTQNARQEAAEGEPVRRHVADVTEEYRSKTGKPVLGLFLAPAIDPNTATTFAAGSWMLPDGKKVPIKIVPMTFTQFRSLFEAAFKRPTGLSPEDMRSWLNELLSKKDADGHIWKQTIAAQITSFVKALLDEAA